MDDRRAPQLVGCSSEGLGWYTRLGGFSRGNFYVLNFMLINGNHVRSMATMTESNDALYGVLCGSMDVDRLLF
jgi:hypothetical protein